MDKLSYALGLGIGRQLAQMGAKDMNIDDFEWLSAMSSRVMT